jgi:hypothetical protein
VFPAEHGVNLYSSSEWNVGPCKWGVENATFAMDVVREKMSLWA